ncbi:ABC transporter permease [Rhodococcus daqingensis]|uniref:ABC transporter permease n=1 Tax=Rhodococcus daqingensis TaxID=2479363 RepID=A0ABW2S545_9NOCA
MPDPRGPRPDRPYPAGRAGQDHFVAGPDEVEVLGTDPLDGASPPTSMWRDAWHSLRRNPLFLAATLLILFVLVVVALPGLFASQDPRMCLGENSMQGPRSGHPFGFDLQGCDVYARTVYGARASVLTGIGATAIFLLIGGTVGALAGFYGGWLDAVVSRITDVFFGIPLILAAIVMMQLFRSRTIWTVMLTLALFAWPHVARIARGSVISVRGNDFVLAAKALGVSRFRTLLRHVLPNAIGPVIVVTTIWLGVFIVTEATLSYLGIGLPPSVVSWGGDISTGQSRLRSGSGIIFYPAAALAVTVLGFIMLGDALRDALDPKARKQ